MVEQHRYLLVKRGLYYRPGNAGYTGIKVQAGRYLESDACEESGISAIHEDDALMFSEACWHDVKVKHLLARIAQLEAALAKSREGWENAIELGLLPPQHVAAATILRDEAEAALQKAEAE